MAVFLSILCLLITVVLGQASYEGSCLRNLPAEPNTIIREVYRKGVEKLTEVECFLKNCNSNTPCAVSFNLVTSECVIADPELLKIAVKLGIPFYMSAGDGHWKTLIRMNAKETNNGPDALWLMDNITRGRNLGKILTRKMDMFVPGLTFTGVGPRGRTSRRRFSTFTSKNRAFVQLEYDGRAMLSLINHFTFATWVNLNKPSPMQGIIDSYYGSPKASRSKDNSPHFWTNGTANLILHLEGFKHSYYTVNTGGMIHEWRHLAVTYSDESGAHFYVNGRPLPIKRRIEIDTGLLQPKFIQIGRRETSNFLCGNLACLAIYERVLSQSEIEHLKDNCP